MDRTQRIVISVEGADGRRMVSTVNGFGESRTSYFRPGGGEEVTMGSQSFRSALVTLANNIVREYDPEGLLR